MSDELRECPNRTCRSAAVAVLWDRISGKRCGICHRCGTAGPRVKCDKSQAVANWNALSREPAIGPETKTEGDELKACPGCGHAGMRTPERLVKAFGDGDPLIGCVHCGIYTRTAAAWDALRGKATPLVWSSEPPKMVGLWWVRYANPEDRSLRDQWAIEIDQKYLERGITRSSEFEFAGPIPTPAEQGDA